MRLFEDGLSKEELKEQKYIALKSSLTKSQHVIEKLTLENKYFKEQIAELKRALYGKSSEAYIAPEQRRFNEPEFEVTTEAASTPVPEAELDLPVEVIEVKAHEKVRGHRKALPDSLPREKVIIELPEDQRVDSEGRPLKVIGYEVSEKLHHEPAKTKVLEIYRAKYGADNGDYTKTAPPEPSIIPKGIATPGLLASITTSKYADGLPLYRLEEIFKRDQIDLKRQTLARWMLAAGQACQPLINILSDRWHSMPYVSCDETSVQVLKENGRKAESQSWMFVRANPGDKHIVVLFDYTPNRNQEFTKNLFADYKGTVQSDGLNIYNILTSKNKDVTRIGCNMHGRRYFEKAHVEGQKDGKTLAEQGLKFYKKLYEIEDSIKDLGPPEKFKKRLELAQPIWDEMKTWVYENKPKVPPESKIGKAFSYFDSEYDHLTGYLKNGIYIIDNGFVERAIRKFAIGRNSWLFSDTERGAHASANLYSLVVTAKVNGVNPYKALEKIFTEIPKCHTVDDYEALADIVMGISPI